MANFFYMSQGYGRLFELANILLTISTKYLNLWQIANIQHLMKLDKTQFFSHFNKKKHHKRIIAMERRFLTAVRKVIPWGCWCACSRR